MSKQIIFNNNELVKKYKEKIIRITNEKVEELKSQGTGIDFLRQIKFTQSGYDPLFEKPLNFIEQANQTFTYLVSLLAVEKLLEIYPSKSFKVNFGTSPGYDIESINGDIICECFSSTKPSSNSKLKNDVERLCANKTANKKYVIFYSEIPESTHVENIKNKYKEVELIQLSTSEI